MINTFWLKRTQDVSGVSGTGKVAVGAEFPDGQCVLQWTGLYVTFGIYNSIHEIEAIHGHDGRTEIVWDD